METARYRHEYKYILSQAQILMEDAKINTIAELDSYVGEQGYYNIRSLYFDDYENSCFMANENGIDNREKYRIRIYNGAKERIKLELKQKCHGMTLKRNCGISLQQCEMLMAGRVPSDIKEDQQVLWKLAYLMETRLMMPKIIVDYDRIPYVYRPGDANVRITFDKNIKSTFIGTVEPSYKPGVTLSNLNDIMPEFVSTTLKDGIKFFDTRLHGFANSDSILTGMETRSSSPVRILRDENLVSNIRGIYPCGEGAGYAGGIMSAAVDGIKCAIALIENNN